MKIKHVHLSQVRKLSLLFAFFICQAKLDAQITLVASNATANQIALGGSYIQNFNLLPYSGSETWLNNNTLPGWYANLTRGQVSTGKMVETGISTISAVATGSVGASATLNSLGASGSASRALGGTPSVYTTGTANIFSSQSVNVVLRVKNSTGGVLTGLRIAYDTVGTSIANKNAVSFAYRVFSAGSGTISSDFIETHRYLNTYNGSYSETMRTEYGRRVSSTTGWTCVVKDIAPTAESSRTDSLAFNLRDLAVNPGDEVWFAWHISKEDEQGTSDALTTTAIDNVTLTDFTVGRPGLPVITEQPRALEIATGLNRDFTLSVAARGSSLTYQWRKNGVAISGATASTYVGLNATSTLEGAYDVVVSNSSGSVTSLPATVNTYAKKTITTVSNVSFAAYSSSISQLKAATAGTLCDLYYPSSMTANAPAIIVIHGGGGNNGDKTDSREVEAAQELAARGWFVMVINYAMSSSTVQCWPYNLWDAKQAVRWLKQKADAGTYKIDKTKIGVLGFSWGCNMASMLAMTGPANDSGVASQSLKVEPPTRGDSYDSYSTAVQCSIVLYGAADLPNYHQMNQFLDYTGWDNRTLYRRASPVNYPNSSAAPMMVIHGSADDDVWPSQTESTYLMQSSSGATLESYLLVPGGQHSFGLFEDAKIETGFPNPIDIRPETIGFLVKYLVNSAVRPGIVAHPQSKNVNAGASATFSVTATGAPAPTFQWRKDGVAISGATSSSYSTVAAPSSSGYYDVVVTNSGGSLTSTAALFTVEGAISQVAPVANPDSANTSLNTSVTLNVLDNDTDQNGDVLTITSATPGANGTTAVNSGLSITYTPTSGFLGNDSFTYTISDGNGGAATATVSLSVSAVALVTNVTVSAEATITSSTSSALDIDEATAGYNSTKYAATPSTSSARKAYFQFEVSALSLDNSGTATFTVAFNNSYQQRVQLWALNQSYLGFTAISAWNTAQANDLTSNALLSSGNFTATAIGSSVLLAPGASPYTPATFTIPNIGSYSQGGRITLVLTGEADALNNSSGARYTRGTATLRLPLVINTAPTISDITNRTVNEDSATSVIAFTVGDAETPVANLIVTASSSNINKVPLSGIVVGGTGANRTIQVTPAPNEVGQSAITVTVTDAGGLSVSDSFIVTVTAVNDVPTISSIANQAIDEDTATQELAFTISDIESSSALLTVTGSSSDQTLVPNANIIIAGNTGGRTVTITPAANQSGTCTITLVVSDGTATTSTTFTVTVTAVNDLPTISSVANQAIDEATATQALAFTISDIESSSSLLSVTGSSSDQTLVPNANIFIAGNTGIRTVTITPAANQSGTCSITLAVSDGTANASTTFTVTVNLSPYHTWRAAQFGSDANNPAVAGDLADPDSDGLSNLLEYALGGSASTNDSSQLPQAVLAGEFLTITVVERINDSNLTTSAEGSTDLTFALPIVATRTELGDQSGVDNGFKRVTYSVSTIGNPKMFIRLKAILN